MVRLPCQHEGCLATHLATCQGRHSGRRGRGRARVPFSPHLGHGRYNNQWMVVDYKAFTPGRTGPGSKVLTVLEQIP